MERSENARKAHEYMKNSFPAFARKLAIALEGITSVQKKLEYIAANDIRYHGAVVYKSMLTAAQNCVERLDDRAIRTLRYIDRLTAGKSDLTSAFSSLNRILQTCSKELEKSNAAMWGVVTVPGLVNHVLDFIAWALTYEKIEAGGVTTAWLEKNKENNGIGAMRMVLAKIYLRIFVETLVQDLPGTSVA